MEEDDISVILIPLSYTVILIAMNNEFGDGKLRLSSDKNGHFYHKRLVENNKNKKASWLMKSSFRSPSYTTNWYEIPKVKTNR